MSDTKQGNRLLTVVYPVAVQVTFGLGFPFRSQIREGWSFHPAMALTLLWFAMPTHFLPVSVHAFLNAFYDLPLILSAVTLNIAPGCFWRPQAFRTPVC